MLAPGEEKFSRPAGGWAAAVRRSPRSTANACPSAPCFVDVGPDHEFDGTRDVASTPSKGTLAMLFALLVTDGPDSLAITGANAGADADGWAVRLSSAPSLETCALDRRRVTRAHGSRGDMAAIAMGRLAAIRPPTVTHWP